MFNFDSMEKEWFASWFDSPYYHTLYKDRNDSEAENFISNLVKHLALPNDSHVLDLACGKGRHSVTLNKLGYKVLGVDLSPNSIKEASKLANDSLAFKVQDMRNPIEGESFDAIFNLFTSFGYFDDLEDNNKVVNAMRTMLCKNGILVIDFMNASKVIRQLVQSETKIVDGIQFEISRSHDGSHIFKNIQFETNGTKHEYTERVQAIRKNQFEHLLSQNGFQILCTFGDFDLAPFDEENSDRLIIVARRI